MWTLGDGLHKTGKAIFCCKWTYLIFSATKVVCNDADRPTNVSCQTGQVRFRTYLPRLKLGCPQKCMCLAMSKS